MSNEIESMEEQLLALYREKELLQEKLGVSDAQEIIDMIESMNEQLMALYEEKDGDKE